MQRTLLTLLGLVLVIGATVATFMVISQRNALQSDTTATTTPNLTGQAIFTDGVHGFSIRYPDSYGTDYTFQTFYHLPANWRENALPEGTGTPVLAVISYRTESDHSYPRYFDAEVRIGVSSDAKELARCEIPALEQGEQQLPDVNLGGTAFKVFSFQDAAAMQYVKGVSYRVIHEGTCVAIDKLQTGSNYRDDPASKDDIPQQTLDAAYDALDAVIQTFSFSRP